MRLKSIIWFALILTHQVSLGQPSLELIKSVPIQNISRASLDKQNNIYLVDNQGNIDKYNEAGDLLLHYSTGKSQAVTLIESRNPLRVFTFHQDFQEYQLYDRFLIPSEVYDLTDLADFAGMVTISADNNIWLIDYTTFSLKKYDVTFLQNVIERPLDLILDLDDYDITHMMEYQNLLLIADAKSGILQFDNLGNYIRTIKTDYPVSYFNCLGNLVYYANDMQLIRQDIYNGTTEEMTLPLKAKMILMTQKRIVLIAENVMNLYKY